MVSRHADRRTLDSRHFAVALIDDLGLDAVAVRPLEIHAQQHGRPVLGFGSAGPGLNVQKGVVRVHLTREHALKLEPLHVGFEPVRIRLDLLRSARITLGGR